MMKRNRPEDDELIDLGGFEPIRISLLAAIGAGRYPDSSESPMEHRWTRPVPHARKRDNFGYVRVVGNSLDGDGIRDGDILIIRTNFESYDLTPGRLVVVDTPFGLLAKRLFLGLNGHVRLVSSNPRFQDLVLEHEECRVLGLIVRFEHDI